MAQHESIVNFGNLIRDLAEMYPREVAEVVVVELVANALDAHATRVSIDYDTQTNVLVVADNGLGMNAAQFQEYHDFAAGLKTRGESGIGFAGVGAKISFNIADRVLTETSGQNFSGGSDWYLDSNHRLVWDDIKPTNVRNRGTRVEVRFRFDVAPPYATQEELIMLLRRNYLPLFDIRFLDLYDRLNIYSRELRFIVNGLEVDPSNISHGFDQDSAKEFLPRRGKSEIGFGVLGLTASDYSVSQDMCGVLLCAYGKVIKADLFNQFPGLIGPRILGIVEIPSLIKFLTTSKTDFIRSKGRNRDFEQIYDPVRQEFQFWLSELGVRSTEDQDPAETDRLERELRRLAATIPELSDFFGFRKQTNIPQLNDDGIIRADVTEGMEVTFPSGGDGSKGNTPGPVDVGNGPGEALNENQDEGTVRASSISRTARRGPKISFDSRPDRIELAWVDGNRVVIKQWPLCL